VGHDDASAKTGRRGHGNLEEAFPGNRLTLASDLDGRLTIEIHGRGNRVEIGPGLERDLATPTRRIGHLYIVGNHNRVVIGPNVKLKVGSRLRIRGHGNTLQVGGDCSLRLSVALHAGGADFRIGAHCTGANLLCTLHEPHRLWIGDDCIFASQVWISVSDMHPIFDRTTGERLNPGADVRIGDHVWFGHGVKVLKGVEIGSGSILGVGSIVTGSLPENCLVAGVPAKILRRNVVWSRDFPPAPVQDPQSLGAEGAFDLEL